MKAILNDISGFLHLLAFKDFVIIGLVFVILVLLLVIYYILKIKEYANEEVINLKEELDLKSISEELEEPKIKPKFFTEYEEDQEEKAIISYQELLNKSSEVNFLDIPEDEYQNFEVKIKKINLEEPKENSSTKIKEPKPKNVPLMSYQSDDEFLLALKKLQNNLSK